MKLQRTLTPFYELGAPNRRASNAILSKQHPYSPSLVETTANTHDAGVAHQGFPRSRGKCSVGQRGPRRSLGNSRGGSRTAPTSKTTTILSIHAYSYSRTHLWLVGRGLG